MRAALCAFIVGFLTLRGPTVVSGVLSRPTNVRLTSKNMDLVLRWDPPEGAAGDPVYTAELRPTYDIAINRAGCVNTSHLLCDFTRLGISEFGNYTGRVRAQLAAESSAWVESNHIALDTDTILGAPSVRLFSSGATIEVSIKDPVLAVSSFRNVYITPVYNLTYWIDGQKEKARSISNIEQNWVILSNLDVWTKYCVQVQVRTRNPRPSKPSRPVCESTTNKEEAPWVAAVVTFFVMAVAVALVAVTVVYHKTISHFLCPKDALPPHFKKHLLAPPNSSVYLAMRDSRPPEEVYDRVRIVAHDGSVEEECPLEAAAAAAAAESPTAEERDGK